MEPGVCLTSSPGTLPDVDGERGRFPGSKDAARVRDREHNCSRKVAKKLPEGREDVPTHGYQGTQ
jgi:hypothetical protein